MSRPLAAYAHTTLQRMAVALLASLFALCVMARAGEVDDLEARVVQLERPEQPLDTPAPPSRFIVPKGDTLWDLALARATKVQLDHGGGFFPASDLVGEGFRSAVGFSTEKFSEDDSGGEQKFVLSADKAVKEGTHVQLAQMRVVYFLRGTELTQAAPADKAGGNDKGKGAAAPKVRKPPRAPQELDARKPKHDGYAAAKADPAEQYRVVITAPEADIDVITNTFSASGKVTVEVYQRSRGKSAPGKADAPDGPIAVLSAERLMWRTWDEPQAGAKELAVYTPGVDPGQPDPLVTATYVMRQSDGTATTILMQGRGLVYEVGSYDRPNTKEDEDGRTAGLSKVSRNRAVFHRHVRLETTAAGMGALMPFQGIDGMPPATVEPAPAGKQAAAAAPATPPSRTVLSCAGPAVLNLAAVPRAGAAKPVPRKGAAAGSVEPGASVAPVDMTQEEILLSRRFEFYNNVSVVKTPLEPPPGAPAGPEGSRAEMKCAHLCMQYAADTMPGPATFPEYAEALDGVRMNGVSVGTARPGVAPPAPEPYSISCQRIYYDGPNDNTFLVGAPAAPVEVKQAQGDVSAQQFCYRRRTQTLTMPVSGPKRMVIKSAALAPAPPDGKDGQPSKDRPGSPFNMSAGETSIKWRGPMSREIRHLPVPHGPDRIKEVLVLQDAVEIEQPAGGLRMRGQVVRVVRNVPGGGVEFLESRGDVDVSLGELQVRGELVTVETESTPQGEVLKDVTTVVGNRAKGRPATLFTEGSAVRSEKFIIDRKADTFQSFGGAIAVVKPAAAPASTQPKPPEAQDAGGLFKGISFDAGGTLRLQCDGEFSQDGATHKVRIRKNVLITQPADAPEGLEKRMRADDVEITLEDAPAAAAGAPPTPAGQFFSGGGGLKSLECQGNVELSTPEQLVQCDRLLYDKANDSSAMQVNEPDNDVRIYMHDQAGTRILSSRKSLVVDGKSGKFTPGGVFVILPYRADAPAPRDKESSPARRKPQPVPRTNADGRK